jgi:hypothetical protein
MTARKLTKADLILGTKNNEDVEIEGVGGTVTLRPLTEGEYLRAQVIILNAMKAGGAVQDLQKAAQDAKKKGSKGNPFEGMNIQMDLGALTSAEFDQNVFIVSCGLVDPKLTMAEIQEIQPIGTIKKLAARILEMSGIGDEMENQISNFRKK